MPVKNILDQLPSCSAQSLLHFTFEATVYEGICLPNALWTSLPICWPAVLGEQILRPSQNIIPCAVLMMGMTIGLRIVQSAG